jgi:hypothetical protein
VLSFKVFFGAWLAAFILLNITQRHDSYCLLEAETIVFAAEGLPLARDFPGPLRNPGSMKFLIRRS